MLNEHYRVDFLHISTGKTFNKNNLFVIFHISLVYYCISLNSLMFIFEPIIYFKHELFMAFRPYHLSSVKSAWI
jgi:hypothetical protein